MTILSLATDVLPYLKLSADDSFANVARIHNSVESFVKSYCNRNFESASYKEVITDYRGGSVVLKNYPVTAISKISSGLADVITVKNTNAYSIATIQVTSTGVTLTYNTTTQTVDWATYTTMTTVVDQINALGNGWVGALVSSGFATIISTELVKNFGQSALNSVEVRLGIVDTNVSYDLVDDIGVIVTGYYDTQHSYYTSGNYTAKSNFYDARAYLKLYVNYTAGYSAADMPVDLEQGMLSLIQYYYQKVLNNSTGVKSFSIDDYSVTYGGSSSNSGLLIPDDVAVMLDGYKNLAI